MARKLSSPRVAATLQATVQNDIDGAAVVAAASQGAAFNPFTALANGTAANQADRCWGDSERNLGSGATENIDLYDLGAIDIGGGAGKDALGQAMAMVEIVALLIVNRATSAGTLKIGGEGSAAAFNSIFDGSDTAKTSIGPGGCVLWFSPADPAYVIVDAANHLLKLEASGGACTYDIYFLGRSA